ncbi:MAG: N-acetyltransferase [Lentisphaeria bacterium]|jgi:ribosomal protein S18 acetylase RimI-like enzyme
MPSPVLIRRTAAADREAIVALVRATNFFRPDEVETAAEVLDEAIAKGPAGHYQSFTAEVAGEVVGWVCHGPTPCTLGTYDIYWLAVHPARQGHGLGRKLLAHAEAEIRARGGRLAVAETSGKAEYASTRAFYLRVGYQEAARLPDFYAPGDDKVFYLKRL